MTGRQPKRKPPAGRRAPGTAVSKKASAPAKRPQERVAAPRQPPLPYDGLGPGTVARIERRESWRGPAPHPEDLQKYELVQPGFADRLITMAEQEGQSRRDLTASAVQAAISSETRGQYLGFALGVVGLVAAALVLIFAAGTVAGALGGSVLGGGSLVALVALFLRRERHDGTAEG